MAVLALTTDELADDYRGHPVNDHGKLRIQYFNLPATTVAGDATTTVDLCELPSGKVRILPALSRLNTSAFGASRTLDVGHREYQKRDDPSADLEDEDADAFIDGLDVSSAVTGNAFGTGHKFDLYSKGGVTIFATVLGGTIPVGATISGYIVYVYE